MGLKVRLKTFVMSKKQSILKKDSGNYSEENFFAAGLLFLWFLIFLAVHYKLLR